MRSTVSIASGVGTNAQFGILTARSHHSMHFYVECPKALAYSPRRLEAYYKASDWASKCVLPPSLIGRRLEVTSCKTGIWKVPPNTGSSVDLSVEHEQTLYSD